MDKKEREAIRQRRDEAIAFVSAEMTGKKNRDDREKEKVCRLRKGDGEHFFGRGSIGNGEVGCFDVEMPSTRLQNDA